MTTQFPNGRAKPCTHSRTARRAVVYRIVSALVLSAGLFFFVATARSQSETQKAILKLSAASQEVARQLAGLTELPAQQWKQHVGDVAHGEAPDLNDGDWTTVVGSESSHAPQDAVWYRRRIDVPKTLNGYDLTGAKIWFEFHASANGPMPQIIYYDGRRVAMGDDLEPIVLFDRAKQGDSALVAVKLLHTEDQKTFGGATLRIEFAAGRPSPTDLLDELLSAGNLAGSLGADSQSVEQQIDLAAASVDLPALRNADQKAFDASIGKAHDTLEVVKPKLQPTTVRLTGNSHIDAAWLWPWTETVDVVRRTFGTALQLMYEYPQYTYTQSAAAYSEWICQKYPGECDEIAKRVKEGRWEMVGGMWVEPDLNMPDGESQVRQLLVGKRYFKQKFGADVRIGWNPDSFGYNWQLPQIYKRSGIDYFVTQKMAWNDTNQLPLKLFWWESPDGSRVLAYFPHDYVNEIEPVKIAADVSRARELNPGLTEMMHLYGVGDHGGGPTRDMLDSGIHWSDPARVFPKMIWGVAQGFFSDVEKSLDPIENSPVWNYKAMAAGPAALPAAHDGKISIPTWKDELYFEYHRGVMTSQSEHKRRMREGEEQVLNAEKLSSMAALLGADYPGLELTEAWKKVLFNQFHDLAAGSGIAPIYQDAARDYEHVRLVTSSISEAATRTIGENIDTRGAGVPVMIVNPLAWTRGGTVEFQVQMLEAPKAGIRVLDSAGKPLPFQILLSEPQTQANNFHLRVVVDAMPSMGYEILRVVPGVAPAVTDLSAHDLTLENAALRVTVDGKTGCITSLFDKRANFESIAKDGCGNELIAFKDTPKDYDAWNIDSDFEKVTTPIDGAESVKLVEKGPLRAIIRVVRAWQHSHFQQDITLYAGSDVVQVANDFDWHEDHVLLKAAFPLAASSASATYEIPYGSIERPTTRNNSWEAAKFEVPALRWADLGDADHGFSLINNTKYGYDAKADVLRLSLLRAPTWPDPQVDRGRHSFSYELYPHAADWKKAETVRRGYEFNYPLQAFAVTQHPGKLPARYSYVEVSSPNVVLTAMKKAEDSSAIIYRFYEWAGGSGTVDLTIPGATRAFQTNLMEEAMGQGLPVAGGGKVSVPVHPYEIVTVSVDSQ
jgi:alpha-mannosidase